MDCEQFKKSYHRFDGTNQKVIHWKDVETPEYAAYSDHMQDCPSCRDWFHAEQLTALNIDASQYPCIHMAYHANYRCGSHHDAWECPSALIIYLEQYDEYGIPIRDGQGSYWKIDNCPWCGAKLPDSKRNMWIWKLRALGYDPFSDYERIPEAYKSGSWYREGNGPPDLRLV